MLLLKVISNQDSRLEILNYNLRVLLYRLNTLMKVVNNCVKCSLFMARPGIRNSLNSA